MSPLAVVLVPVLQLLLAAAFVVVPLGGARYGRDAHRAAEADVVRQGFPTTLLRERRIDFGASRASVVLALGIAVVLAAIAVLGLAGAGIATTLSWVAAPVMLVLGLVVMPGEVFTTAFLERAFAKSRDQALEGIDVRAFVDAARHAFPGWFLGAVLARFLLATLGSLAVIALLLLG